LTAVPNVEAHVRRVINAVAIPLVSTSATGEAAAVGRTNVAPTSPTAWARNKTETNTEKASSVYRESFCTRCEAEVTAKIARQMAATNLVAA